MDNLLILTIHLVVIGLPLTLGAWIAEHFTKHPTLSTRVRGARRTL